MSCRQLQSPAVVEPQRSWMPSNTRPLCLVSRLACRMPSPVTPNLPYKHLLCLPYPAPSRQTGKSTPKVRPVHESLSKSEVEKGTVSRSPNLQNLKKSRPLELRQKTKESFVHIFVFQTTGLVRCGAGTVCMSVTLE